MQENEYEGSIKNISTLRTNGLTNVVQQNDTICRSHNEELRSV